jgi:hypothetical protein
MANNKNLGYRVTLRNIDYGALVREQWGEEWNKRYVIQTWDNGRQWLDTDRDKTGVYGVQIVSGLSHDPMNLNSPNSDEVMSMRIMNELFQGIGVDNPGFVPHVGIRLMLDNGQTGTSFLRIETGQFLNLDH